MMLVGAVAGFLISTVIGDLIGRKTLLILCMGLTLMGLIITIFCQSLAMAGVGLFISIAGIQDGFVVCLYFISETVTEEYR